MMTIEPAANPWVVGRMASGVPTVRLLCLPQAGGAAGAFSAWREFLPDGLEVVPVELPGRGTRNGDPMPATLERLADSVLDALRPELDVPYALFGHSFGGLVAYEAARRIERRGLPRPRALLLSAARPPHLPAPDTDRSRFDLADDAALLGWLRRTGGIPEVLLRHPDYVALVLRSLRADATLTSRYRPPAPAPLACPLHVFGGLADPVVPPRELEEWERYEGPDFTLTLYPGDHFYLYRAPAALLADLAALLRAAPPPEGTSTR